MVETGKHCPVGWHVSTDKEWELLAWIVGGFSALPAGFVHDFTGSTSSYGYYASFWTSDEYSRAFGWGRSILSTIPNFEGLTMVKRVVSVLDVLKTNIRKIILLEHENWFFKTSAN